MALATVRSCALDGVRPRPITVEVHIGGGLPGMSIVGLPNSAVREARDRVRAALSHLGFRMPQVKVTVNLAPADVPKDGGRFDLPIALGLLLATRQLPAGCLDSMVVVGELGLGGELRSVPGALPVALSLYGSDDTLLLPATCVEEAALASRTPLLWADSLDAAVAALRERRAGVTGGRARCRPYAGSPGSGTAADADAPDMSDVIGQPAARRALEIAAAGGHALLMHGAPGTGKSMLARRLPGLCPPLSEGEALELASIRSVAGLPMETVDRHVRAYRAPHHTASAAALVGGGQGCAPGEISLAHNGILFLDELAEFPRRVLDALREPLETGSVCVSRAARRADYPARFQLVAAMNPCPCGYHGEAGRCRCGAEEVRRYRARVSGPLLDRIDLGVALRREAVHPGIDGALPESSAAIAQRVHEAARRQQHRQGGCNARLPPRALRALVAPGSPAAALLAAAGARWQLSRRGVDRILAVARTVADLAGHDAVSDGDLAEALAFRSDEAVASEDGAMPTGCRSAG